MTFRLSSDMPFKAGAWLKSLAGILSRRFKLRRDISVVLVDSRTMAKLNLTYRGKPGPTDVLSFPLTDSIIKGGLAGEIFICLPILRAEAKKRQHSLEQEFKILLVHGCLHILGYDHHQPRKASIMHALESELLTQVGANSGFKRQRKIKK